MSEGGELMAKEVFIPKLGQTMEEATILRWLFDNGAAVEVGQEILEVETDKAVFSVESPGRGTLHLGPYKAGDIVPVLQVVATVGKPDEAFSAGGPAAATPESAEPVPAAAPAPAAPAPVTTPRQGRAFASPRARALAQSRGIDVAQVSPTGFGGDRVVERDVLSFLAQAPKATPVAQRVAEEAGVDLRRLSGSGAGGQITKGDVMRAMAPVASSPEAEILARVPFAGVRALIADRMAASVHTAARVTLNMDVDATEFVGMRERLKARVEAEWGFAPGFNDLLVKVVGQALREYPYMNARLAADAVEHLAHVHVGIAVDTERGLLVPVIHHVEQKTLRQIGEEARQMFERARAGRSLLDELQGGTFTITNLGMYDVRDFTPVINLPEAAILGVGTITSQPVARDDQVVIRKIMHLSLAFDHRLVDGAPAARFMQRIKHLIEEPYLLVAG
jgi:pyruvate dehydrogenase E2 component (dihydrolipoamide acetyltransferase)